MSHQFAHLGLVKQADKLDVLCVGILLSQGFL